MLVAAAVLPHPPLLVPEISAGAAAELDELRSQCEKAIDTVLGVDLDRLVLVGGGASRSTLGPGARGSLTGFGVPVEVCVPGAAPTGEPVLPLSASVGCWLLSRQLTGDISANGPVSVEVVASGATPQDAAALGAELAASADRVGLLVMGDGSATLTPKAPGYVVDGATGWQQGVDRALGAADVVALAALSTDDAHRYTAAGRAAWQVLAGAARAGDAPASDRPLCTWRAMLLAAEAPYGVGYTVATWQLEPK